MIQGRKEIRKKRRKTKQMKGRRERKSNFRKSVMNLRSQNQLLNEKMFLTDLQTEKYQSVSWWPSHRVSSCLVSQNVILDLWAVGEHNPLEFKTNYTRTFRSNLYQYLLSTQHFWCCLQNSLIFQHKAEVPVQYYSKNVPTASVLIMDSCWGTFWPMTRFQKIHEIFLWIHWDYWS